MGLFETTDSTEAPELPALQAPVVSKPQQNRPVAHLASILSLIAVTLLLLALFQGKTEQRELYDLDAVGSLETYSHVLYEKPQATNGINKLPMLAEMLNIRSRLQHDYPMQVERTDPVWSKFLLESYNTGHVDFATATTMYQSIRDLGEAIRDDSQARFLRELWLYALGALIVGIILLRVLRMEQDNLNGSLARRTEHNFATAVLDSLQEGILACDSAGKLTLINRATRLFHGMEDAEISPVKWAENFCLYSADGSRELERDEHPLVRAQKGELIEDQEVLVVNGHGPVRYCVVNGRPIHDDKQANLGAAIIMHDISDKRRVEQEVMRLASIVECSTDAIFGANLDGILVSWNAAATQLYGYEPADVVGRHASILVEHGDTSSITEVTKSLLRGETIDPIEMTICTKDGSHAEISLRYSSIKDVHGNTIGVSATATDITVRKRAEEALRDSQARLAEAQRVARMGSWEIDIATDQIVWSLQMYRLFDFDPADGPPSRADINRRYHPEDLKASEAAIERAIETCLYYEVDVRIIMPDGSMKYCQVVGEPVVDINGKAARLIGTVMDITERKQAEHIAKEASIALEFQKKALEEANTRLENLATSDGLTGLRNRRALDSQLDQEFARSSRYKATLSLLLMDIDFFKKYNDSFGHQAGDDVLRAVAELLQNGTRESDIVARYGGEELCIVLPETNVVEAFRIAERLRLAVANHPWEKQKVTVSMGISTYQSGMRTAHDLVLAADQALYISKAEGRNRVTLADNIEDVSKAA
jgi:diguanylate cyclase (GGDEF)-like protein/PAS domain S-box-containing protein